ncbi:hypothetical protein VDG1235_4170 [Verrucomicrobiia bacterium DG1235]|nr:hypothetical protein VDG1235_4170 [Verrucomicrobiae bacterium DG1235]
MDTGELGSAPFACGGIGLEELWSRVMDSLERMRSGALWRPD